MPDHVHKWQASGREGHCNIQNPFVDINVPGSKHESKFLSKKGTALGRLMVIYLLNRPMIDYN
jgi:hypothetical protein